MFGSEVPAGISQWDFSIPQRSPGRSLGEDIHVLTRLAVPHWLFTHSVEALQTHTSSN